MADNWLTRQLRDFVYGPQPGAIAALSAPFERRDYGYAGRYVLPNPLKLGTLIHGPGATQLYRDALGYSDADNSAVAACLNAITRAYNEVPLRHYRTGPDGPAPVAPSPIDALLARPNPHMTLRQLRRYWQWSKQAHGNAYLVKVRADDELTGEVIELWPVSPSKMTPIRDKDSNEFISAYRYYYANGKYRDIDPVNVVHFKMGIDDENQMLGCSPLRHLIREIGSDARATRFADRLLANKGTAGMVVSYPVDSNATQEEGVAVKAVIDNAFGGDSVGATAVLNNGGKAAQMGFSPADMDLTALHRLPEERIAGVLGIPAIIAGLGAGLDRATYANFKEAREMFTEQLLIPEWLDDGETLTHQLLRDFNVPATDYLAFDATEARALQGDEDALYTRVIAAVTAGLLTEEEGRAKIGEAPLTAQQQAERATGASDRTPDDMPDAAPQTRMLRLLERKGLSERQIEALILAARDEAVAELLPVLERHQEGQRKRIIARIGG